MAVFTNAAKDAIPDPAVYEDWFNRTDERHRRLAVGTRRYSAVQEKHGRQPRYADFIEPHTGEMIPVDMLRKESNAKHKRRTETVDQIIAQRQADISQIATYGFLTPAI